MFNFFIFLFIFHFSSFSLPNSISNASSLIVIPSDKVILKKKPLKNLNDQNDFIPKEILRALLEERARFKNKNKVKKEKKTYKSFYSKKKRLKKRENFAFQSKNAKKINLDFDSEELFGVEEYNFLFEMPPNHPSISKKLVTPAQFMELPEGFFKLDQKAQNKLYKTRCSNRFHCKPRLNNNKVRGRLR